MSRRRELKEPVNVLFRIKRGLAGYVSYLAACEMNQAFSEYVLYEPMLRILMARGYTVRCEYPCPPISAKKGGDRKRIDFVAEKEEVRFAIEVKWAKKKYVSVAKDHEKLAWFRGEPEFSRAFLCVFGRRSHIEHILLKAGNYGGHFSEKGSAIYADFRKTKFGCRIYELIFRRRLQ